MYILAIASTTIILALLSLYRLPGWVKWKRKIRAKPYEDD
jgi:hypothetical protein